MRAIVLDDYGPSDKLRLAQVPESTLGPADVLVKVAYARLRWGDIVQRHGFPSRM